MKDEFCKDTMIYYGEITREEGRAEGREEGRAEGREEGRAEGREEGRAKGLEIRSFDVARDMIKDGFSAELVSKYSRLDLAVVNGLMLMK